MKTTFKVIGTVFALGLVILIVLHVFLLYGLTRTMRKVVLPRIAQDTGIVIQVDRLSVNIVHGRLNLKGIAIRNPEGFLLENLAWVDRIEVEADMASLLWKKPVQIKHVTIHGALLNVIRNREGEVNLVKIQELIPDTLPPGTGIPIPVGPLPGETATEALDAAPLPEILIAEMDCRAKVRYLDFRLNQLDLSLDLVVSGSGLNTWRDPAAEWGTLAVNGSLGTDRTRFVTVLQMGLAPVTDLNALSFDLTGRIMEIDPAIMQEIYDRIGIRSAPFGLDTDLHCRDGFFSGSTLALNIKEIRLEEKLADKAGGMSSIEALRFPVPVEGSLQNPDVNVESALVQALGGNAKSLLNGFLTGVVIKEAGLEEPPENITDAAIEILGREVEEIGRSETAKRVLKDLADGPSSDTNAPAAQTSDVLIDLLGEQVDEIGENEGLKEDLKNLGRSLFGN